MTDAVDALRARLAECEKERDEAVTAWADQVYRCTTLMKERDAATARAEAAEAKALQIETYLEELIAECFGVGDGACEGKRTIDAILEVRRLLTCVERLEKALRTCAAAECERYASWSGKRCGRCPSCIARAALEGER